MRPTQPSDAIERPGCYRPVSMILNVKPVVSLHDTAEIMAEEGDSACVHGIRPAPLSEAQLEKGCFHSFESRTGFKVCAVNKREDTFYYFLHCRKVGRPEGVREMTNLKSKVPRNGRKNRQQPR
jgi:hypothetical protein